MQSITMTEMGNDQSVDSKLLDIARKVFENTGKCQHAYTEEVRPYGTDVIQKDCIVCGKVVEKKFVDLDEGGEDIE